MNLLVAGGAGFIGSNFCHLLERRGHRAVVVDALTYAGSEQNLRGIPPTVLTFVHADIRDHARMSDVITQGISGAAFDAVINFAAESHVDRSISDAMPFVSTNVLGAVTLLEAAKDAGVRTFVQVSTDEVYGSIRDGKFTTSSPLDPSSAYSSSKASADLILRSYYKTHGYDVRITRCTNNYGPYQHAEKLIPMIIHAALNGGPIPIYGDGKQVRDWIFVDDHCDGLFAVLERGQAGGLYHFGGPLPDEVTNLELVEHVLSAIAVETGKPVDELRRLIQHVQDRAGHDRRYALDWSETEAKLQWSPKVPIAEGIPATVQWYLGQERLHARTK